jgi:hypothetical protein
MIRESHPEIGGIKIYRVRGTIYKNPSPAPGFSIYPYYLKT